MLSEVNQAKSFFIGKFGSLENVKPGLYAIPNYTDKEKSFIVHIDNELCMRGLNLLEEKFTGFKNDIDLG